MLSIIILASLIKLNLACETHWLSTIIYTVATAILSLMFGLPLLAIIVGTAINFGLSFTYFSLLKASEGVGTWWLVMIVGMLVFLGLRFV